MPSRLELITEMLEKDPQDPFLHYALALEYVKAGDENKAIGTLRELIGKEKNYLASYYQIGKLLEAKDPDSAKGYYQRGIEIAREQKNFKTLGELNEALMGLED
jgi:tetratricopeptide (TPR) repeat protein